MRILKDLLLIYGTALVTAFFSEMYFVNEGVAFSTLKLLKDPLGFLLYIFELGIWYSLVAAPLLAALCIFKVRSIWALFIAGCFFGVLTEGLIIPAIYLELPVSIFWTATSWHPLICILLGWYFSRIILQGDDVKKVIGLCLGLGLFWGIWSTNLIGNEPDNPSEVGDQIANGVFIALPIEQFFVFTLISTLTWKFGNFLIDKSNAKFYKPGKIQLSLIAFLSISLLIIMSMGVGVVILLGIVMTGLYWVGLNNNKKVEKRENIFSEFKPIPALNYILMLITPAAATLSYYGMTINNWSIKAELVAYPMIIVGILMLVKSYWKISQKSHG